MKRANRFFKNVASNYAIAAVDATIFILLTPFVVHWLGLEIYAVWVIVQTIGYYLGFLDFGLPDAQLRQHAILAARRDFGGISKLHGTVLVLYLCAGGIAITIAGILVALPSASLLDIPTSAVPDYTIVILLIGINALLSFTEGGLDCIFEGYQRFDVMNVIAIGFNILAALATVWLLMAGYGIVSLAVIICVETALSIAAKLISIRYLFPLAAFPRLGFDRNSWRSIRGYSIWNSLNDFMTEGTAHLDKLFIPIFLSSVLLTPYSLIVALASAIFLVAEPITNTFLPISSIRHSRNDRIGLTELISRGTRLVVLATLPITIVIVFFGDAILDLWVGSEYTDVDVAVLWFSAFNFFFSTYLWTSLNILMGSGEIRRIFKISVFEVLLVVVLIVILIPRFGLIGLALGGLIANVVTGIFLFIPAACRKTNLQAWQFLTFSFLTPLLAAVPGYLTGYFLRQSMGSGSWTETLLAAGLTGAVSLIALVLFATSRRDRARYYVALRRLTGVG